MALIKKMYIGFMVMVFFVLYFLWFTQSKEINQTSSENDYICHSTFEVSYLKNTFFFSLIQLINNLF